LRALAAVAALFAGACCTSLPRLAPKRVAFHDVAPEVAGVDVSRAVWRDERRGRDVPVTIYAPVLPARALPVVVFSHGIGEDRDSYEWLGRSLAERGFLTVHVTHAGTDRAVLERGYLQLYRAVKQKENWVNRPLDVSFVLDRLTTDARADMTRVAVAGHSAGAFTAFAVAGLQMTGGSLVDPRVRVAIPMSMPRMDGVVGPGGYDAVGIPVLNMTGTCDTSIIYRTLPRHRRIPFDSAHRGNQVLVTLGRATHDSFVIPDRHAPAVIALTAAFFRAWLLDDQTARSWFDEAGCETVHGTAICVERKMIRANM
jgi:pimeloyl-ACP methyl ester carboxylesterase